MDVTLCYRGYTIEDLAENSHFEETSFLLWNDKLPTASELENFKSDISNNMALDPQLIEVLKKIPHQNIHPMAWLRTAVSLLAHFDGEAQDNSVEANRRKAVRLL